MNNPEPLVKNGWLMDSSFFFGPLKCIFVEFGKFEKINGQMDMNKNKF